MLPARRLCTLFRSGKSRTQIRHIHSTQKSLRHRNDSSTSSGISGAKYFPPNRHVLGNRRVSLRDQHPKRLRGDHLIRYLEIRLKAIEEGTDDKRYAGFLQKLQMVLKVPHVQQLVTESNDSPNAEEASAWRPTEHAEAWSLFKAIKRGYEAQGPPGVDAQLQYAYQGVVADREGAKIERGSISNLTDLQYPDEWYPKAREIQRTIHLHIGPTNSGKTYQALKALEGAKKGLYAGPLRLLAHEVFSRMKAMGKNCDLTTGDERIASEDVGDRISSSTVEMTPLNEDFDVAVIDEIQMIGDVSRGWAWTQAFLGLRAKELHLCGEERTLPLIQELATLLGDTLQVHTYERLSPLKAMSTSLHGDLSNLKKGDCVVSFSRIKVHAMKNQIEQITQKRVAIVYGALPPEVRAQQASLFNDPDNDYDFLVATDAIGMGLNLAVKRIIFETTSKTDGQNYSLLPVNQVKQIAGRAGRFRTAHQALKDAEQTADNDDNSSGNQSTGFVTTLHEDDLMYVRKAMDTQPPPITTAGLLPLNANVLSFARHFPPSVHFSYVLSRLHEIAVVGRRYHLCALGDMVHVADVIQSVPDLTIQDRLIFGFSPIIRNNAALMETIRAYARCVGESRSGELLSIPEIPLEILDQEPTTDREYVQALETLHRAIILYLWLGYRFPGCFIDRDLAMHVRGIVEERIDQVLSETSFKPRVSRRILRARAEIERREAEALEKTNAIEEGSALRDAEPTDVNPVPELPDATEGSGGDTAERIKISDMA